MASEKDDQPDCPDQVYYFTCFHILFLFILPSLLWTVVFALAFPRVGFVVGSLIACGAVLMAYFLWRMVCRGASSGETSDAGES